MPAETAPTTPPAPAPVQVLHIGDAASAASATDALRRLGRPDVLLLRQEPLGAAPDVVWADHPDTTTLSSLRGRWPAAGIMACISRQAPPGDVVALIGAGADLVVRDEDRVLTAASLISLARRITRRPPPAVRESGSGIPCDQGGSG